VRPSENSNQIAAEGADAQVLEAGVDGECLRLGRNRIAAHEHDTDG